MFAKRVIPASECRIGSGCVRIKNFWKCWIRMIYLYPGTNLKKIYTINNLTVNITRGKSFSIRLFDLRGLYTVVSPENLNKNSVNHVNIPW